LEAWYTSGSRDGDDTGEYAIDVALDAAKVEHNKNAPRYESSEQADADWLEIEAMLRSYHDRFGPTSSTPDWPSIRVVHDADGKPIVERELWTPLGENRFYSVRIDLLVSHFGFLKVMEHKTSVPGFVSQRLRSTHTDSQMTGELFTIWQEFPDLPIGGILTNVLVKGRGKASKYDVAMRETTSRTTADYEAFRHASRHILGHIDNATADFEQLVAAGTSVAEAVARCFPDHGTRTGRCDAYGGCPFLQLCHRKDDETSELRMFRPRVLDARPSLELESAL
jgi:hypothetical protein